MIFIILEHTNTSQILMYNEAKQIAVCCKKCMTIWGSF